MMCVRTGHRRNDLAILPAHGRKPSSLTRRPWSYDDRRSQSACRLAKARLAYEPLLPAAKPSLVSSVIVGGATRAYTL
jgi:hypothetical protein